MLPFGSNPNGLAVEGDYAYIVDCCGDFFVIDISDPFSPTLASHYGIPVNGNDVTIADGYAYVASRNGLQVFDVADPANPFEVGTYSGPEYATGVSVSGDYAYVAWGPSGLRIISVADLNNPVLAGNADTPEWASSVAVEGDYAYVVDFNGCLRIFNVANPAVPEELGYYDPVHSTRSVALANGYVYLAGSDDGLLILRFAGAVSTLIRASTGGDILSNYARRSTLIEVGAGALITDSVLSYTHRAGSSTGDLIGVQHEFELSAENLAGTPVAALNDMITVTVRYSDSDLGPAIEESLGLYRLEGSSWISEGVTSTLDAGLNIVTSLIDRLGRFALLGETNWFRLPVMLQSPAGGW